MFIYNKNPVPQLDSLSSENLRFLQDCKESFDNVAELYCGGYRNIRSVNAAFRSALASPRFGGVGGAAEHVRRATQTNARSVPAYARYQWWIATKEKLSQDVYWDNALVTNTYRGIDSQDIFSKAHWRRSEDYSHFTSRALYVLAFDILPSYERHINYIAVDLKAKKHKITQEEAQEVQTFLTSAYKFLKNTRRDIAYAMAARLHAASIKKDLEYDDVTQIVVQQLKADELTNKASSHAESRGLTPRYFNAFHDFIARESPADAFVSLKPRARWLTKDSRYQASVEAGEILIVPTELQPLRQRNWWQRLWKIAPRIDTWLADNRYLIAQCRLLEKKKINVRAGEAAIQEQLEEYREIRNTLTQKINEVKAQKPSAFWKFFRPSQYNRITVCEAFLTSQSQIVADKFIETIEKQIERWEGQTVIARKPTFRIHEVNLVIPINEEIKSLKKQGAMTKAQIEKMDRLAKRFEVVRAATRPEERKIKHYLAELEKGNVKISTPFLSKYIGFLKLSRRYKPEDWKAFQQQSRPAVVAVFHVFNELMDAFKGSTDTIDKDTRDSLARAFFWVFKLGNESDINTLSKQVYSFFGEYLKRLHESEPCHAWIEQAECMLSSLIQGLGDTETKAQLIKLHDGRKANSANFADDVASIYTQHLTIQLRGRCQQLIEALCNKLWSSIKKHRLLSNSKGDFHTATVERFEELIEKAHAAHVKSLYGFEEVTYSERSLLGISSKKGANNHTAEPLRFCDEIIAFKDLKRKVDTLDKPALERLETQLINELQNDPPRLDWSQISAVFFQAPRCADRPLIDSSAYRQPTITLGA